MNTSPKFVPKWGALPPVLAGREKEKARIKSALDDLAEGHGSADYFALIGPRGNGKTALLRWVEEEVENYKGRINCVELNIDYFNSRSDLVQALSDENLFAALAGDGFEATINMFGSGVAFSRQTAAKELLKPILKKKCANKGLVILIDEAHMLYKSPDVARAFFSAVQSLSGKDLPLLLILAGTPSISARLAEIEATFWDRLKKIGVGLLNDAAAREALQTPLERMGYLIETDILHKAASAAQCYPYFIQVVGSELQFAAKVEPDKLEKSNIIGNEILEQALNEFHDRRKNYYAGRYQELVVEGLLPAAEAVARLFVLRKENVISSAMINLAIRQSFDPTEGAGLVESRIAIERAVWNVQTKLRHVGFIWSRIGREQLCEPGIPSLMNYVMDWAGEQVQAETEFRSTMADVESK